MEKPDNRPAARGDKRLHTLVVADTVDRLLLEFPALSAGAVAAVVDECRHDLSAVPPAAEPELLERLARVRLAAVGG